MKEEEEEEEEEDFPAATPPEIAHLDALLSSFEGPVEGSDITPPDTSSPDTS